MDPLERLAKLSASAAGSDTGGHYAMAVIRTADSLLANGFAHDTTVLVAKGDALWQYGHNRYDRDPDREPDSAFAWYSRAAEVYKASGHRRSIAFAATNLAQYHINHGEAGRALTLIKEALPVHEEHRNLAMLIKDHGGLGRAYYMLGDLPRSLDHQRSALGFAKEKGSLSDIGAIEHNIGNIYQDEGQLDTAVAYYARAITAFQQGNQAADRWLVSLYNMIVCRMEQGADDEARRLVDQGLTASAAAPRSLYASLIHAADADLRLKTGDLSGARSSGTAALRMARARGDVRALVPALVSLAAVQLARKEHSAALALASEAGHLCDSLDVGLTQRRNAARALADIYAITGPAEEALHHLRRFQALDDSLRNEPMRKRLAAMDLRKQEVADSLEAAAARVALQEEHAMTLRTERQRRWMVWAGVGVLGTVATVLLWRLRHARKARASSDHLVSRLLPEDVAEELRTKGRVEEREIADVTVLFTDFKSFTRLSEQLAPRELMAEVQTCFHAFDAAIAAHNGTRIKTIGDAYMAAGGMKGDGQAGALCMVRAALEMQEFMRTHKAERKAQGKPFFEMRVGIHTGPVVAGIVGVKKFQYDIWGDTVNTASRMESSGEVGQVNISEATYALVKDEPSLRFTQRGKVKAKGKGEMEMYFVGLV